jgi:hypothetical protein
VAIEKRGPAKMMGDIVERPHGRFRAKNSNFELTRIGNFDYNSWKPGWPHRMVFENSL